MQHNGDNDAICIVLFCGNAALQVIHSIGIMSLLQGIALLASIVASTYVAVDHHMKIKWKKSPQQRKERADKMTDEEKQKHACDGKY